MLSALGLNYPNILFLTEYVSSIVLWGEQAIIFFWGITFWAFICTLPQNSPKSARFHLLVALMKVSYSNLDILKLTFCGLCQKFQVVTAASRGIINYRVDSKSRGLLFIFFFLHENNNNKKWFCCSDVSIYTYRKVFCHPGFSYPISSNKRTPMRLKRGILLVGNIAVG